MKNLKHSKVAFLGAGNMAEALVKGLLAGGGCAASDLRVTDVSPGRLEYFEQHFGVSGSSHNKDIVAWADVVVLAVKPQVLMEVLQEPLWQSASCGASLSWCGQPASMAAPP